MRGQPRSLVTDREGHPCGTCFHWQHPAAPPLRSRTLAGPSRATTNKSLRGVALPCAGFKRVRRGMRTIRKDTGQNDKGHRRVPVGHLCPPAYREENTKTHHQVGLSAVETACRKARCTTNLCGAPVKRSAPSVATRRTTGGKTSNGAGLAFGRTGTAARSQGGAGAGPTLWLIRRGQPDALPRSPGSLASRGFLFRCDARWRGFSGAFDERADRAGPAYVVVEFLRRCLDRLALVGMEI